MAQLRTSVSGCGAIEDPRSDGEYHQIGADSDTFSVDDQDLVEALVETYDHVSVVDGSDDESGDEAICGVEKSDGGICTRDPDSCPYHKQE